MPQPPSGGSAHQCAAPPKSPRLGLVSNQSQRKQAQVQPATNCRFKADVREILQELLSKEKEELSNLASRHEVLLLKLLDQQNQILEKVATLPHEDHDIGAQESRAIVATSMSRNEAEPEHRLPKWHPVGENSQRSIAEEVAQDTEDHSVRTSKTMTPAASAVRFFLGEDGDYSNMILWLIETKSFHFVQSLVIVIHAAWMGYESEKRLQKARSQLGQPLETTTFSIVVEVSFLGFYCIELLLKILGYRRNFFSGREGNWNIFDLLLVCCGIFEAADVFALNVSFMRVLRVIRQVVRALRVFRVMKYFKILRVLILSIGKAMITVFWAIIALAMCLYMFAIIFVQGVTFYITEMPSHAITSDETTLLFQYWGSLGAAILTEYKAITGGHPWEEASEALKPAGNFYYAFFLIYICLLVVALLRMLTGIFVQDAKAASAIDFDEAVKSSFSDLFKNFDRDGSGSITKEEFRASLETEKAKQYFEKLHILPADAGKLFRLLDESGDNEVDISEFINGCQKFSGFAKNIDMAVATMRINVVEEQLKIFMEYVEECTYKQLQYMQLDQPAEPLHSRIHALRSAATINLDGCVQEHRVPKWLAAKENSTAAIGGNSRQVTSSRDIGVDLGKRQFLA